MMAMTESSRNTPSGIGRFGPLIIVAVCLAVYFFLNRPPGVLAGWSTDYDQAAAMSKETGKGMLIAFHSENCPPCYAMERSVLREKPVVEAIQQVVAVKVDVGRRPDLGAKFNVIGTPTYTLVSSSGSVIDARMGYVETDDFVSFIAQASAE